MPRKSQTQERFRTISIEDSLYQELHRNKLPGEPIYQTAHRMFRKYHQSELEDAEFMINEYQGVMQRQTEKLKVIERYV